MITEEVNVLIFLGYALFNGFLGYQLGKDDGWRKGYADGWCAHKKVSAAIEEFSRAVFDAGTTWNGDEQADEHVIERNVDGSYKCSICGCVVDYDIRGDDERIITMDDYVIPFGFCPSCGAEVVDE